MSFVRRVKTKLLPLGIKDSYPFISGDAYRIRCHYDLARKGNLSQDFLLKIKPDSSLSIFVGGETEGVFLLKFLESLSLQTNWTLVFHNQDISPNESIMYRLSSHVEAIYSEGWLGDKNFVKPIPAGLENVSKLRNGVPYDWRRQISQVNKVENRDISVFISFKVGNNKLERSGIDELFKNVPNSFSPTQFLSPKEYRKTLLRSKFVVSPPGNGPDCHRTWEALYSGAIPIVLEEFWPFAETNLPVLVVERWVDALIAILDPFNSLIKTITPQEIWDTFMVDL